MKRRLYNQSIPLIVYTDSIERTSLMWVSTVNYRVHVAILCAMTPRSDVIEHQCFGGPYCIHLQDENHKSLIYCSSKLNQHERNSTVTHVSFTAAAARAHPTEVFFFSLSDELSILTFIFRNDSEIIFPQSHRCWNLPV
jgi:hypothetical protein